jgi:quercetin dioxygenase-like cupin family protein
MGREDTESASETVRNETDFWNELPRLARTPDQLDWMRFTDVPNVKFANPENDAIESAHLEGDIEGPGLRADMEIYPAGMTVAPHMHPNAERVYIIEGSLDLQLGEPGEEETVTYPAGSYLVVPAYTRHVVSTPQRAKVLVIQLGRYAALRAAG